ncbi:histidine ammonia-lyase [Mangrovivirga sp. M17]|uniref:Histidine ammonia-lyase n=1 Tax=Mangrovivirga halotolerans TaxID=2993936 RepID=A0ABT3RL15_9BACT|nr:histidine ammonia-lyase [Mangrovivirga halotolerans]MCX2742399.1 histidine ammonia-lyase [Mangrovivirga halotolerans]
MQKEKHLISSKHLDFDKINDLVTHNIEIELSEEAKGNIIRCREYLDKTIQESDQPIYGINTGFGSLYKHSISKEDLGKLQENLVKSHACGAGKEIDPKIVRIMLLLKIQSLSYGNSGVQLSTVERLIGMFNNNITPIIYEYGSLGASGDLAPLAHLCLPLIGEGKVHYKDDILSGKEINTIMGWEPIQLQAKEGLALLNGTQFMSAFGVWCLIHAKRISTLADVIGAASLDAFDGRIEPFNALVHKIRPQKGQIATAERIRKLLEGSELIKQTKKHVQDPYSFRCIPQVHGASKDALKYTYDVFVTEVNCVTDNPNIFPEEDEIISGGNFHGQPLALALDFLAIALAELGNISERRTFQLVSGSRDLPDFLVAKPGLNSGLMIPQYTAASMVSSNKQLAVPSSTDSIVSSNGQEDHVSMGANSAVKAFKVIDNLYSILGIELICASQAISFRRPLKTSPLLEDFLNNFCKEVSFIDIDRVLHDDIVNASNFLKRVEIERY